MSIGFSLRLLLLAPQSLLQAPPKFENIPNLSFMKLQFYPSVKLSNATLNGGSWVWLGRR